MIAQMPAVLLQQDKLSKFSNSKTSVQYFTANKNKNKNKTAVNEKRVKYITKIQMKVTTSTEIQQRSKN